MIADIGLLMIIVAWIFQIYRALAKKDLQFNLVFLSFYIAGCLLLSVAGFMQKDMTSAILQLICTILPVIVLAAFIRLKK
ncbi:MAG: hypothetical protein JXB43_07290 [Dehalococcoidia bacterium]|nr:hypothetical protein [Dehalococcoidia bacterium]